MTTYLQRDGYPINRKKLYGTMGEDMLRPENRIHRSGSGRKSGKFRKVITSRPFECPEMDIRMVRIPNAG